MTPDPLEPRVLVGDVMERLADMAAESVHCVVTSPPYFGLRDYGTGEWDGGDSDCDHVKDTAHQKQGATSQRSGRTNAEAQRNENFRDVCGKCGATRIDRQIGLEPTLDEYVETMVRVFREVRRVLRPDGTVWLNLGDSYVSQPARPGTASGFQQKSQAGQSGALAQFRPQVQDQKRVNGEGTAKRPPAVEGLKQKDLMMVPARVALALQADGWWLRKEIIWAKPNPMPESTTDRPTSSHEKLYLLAKSSRYFYDIEAVREPHSPDGRKQTLHDHDTDESHPNYDNIVGSERWPNGGRNKRDVWTIATESYAEAHFATFPTILVEPCILAGTSEKGCCPGCGAPLERITGRDEQPQAYEDRKYDRNDPTFATKRNLGGRYQAELDANPLRTLGWVPSCTCGQLDPVPCTVLDPFAGSGTTLVVARRLNRASVGVELNPEYAALAAKRLARWWEKPTNPRDEPVDGQISLLDAAAGAA